MSSNKNNYMVHRISSSSSSRDNNDNLKLPPISSMDSYLPTRTWNPPSFSAPSPKELSTTTTSLPTPPQLEQWKSPPYNSKNELTRDSLYKSPLLFSSTSSMTDQQQQHSPIMQSHHNKPLESSSYFEYTSKAYHLQQQEQQQQKKHIPYVSSSSSSTSFHNTTVNKVDHDIDQVVLQCNKLCDNIIQHKDQFINHNHHQEQSSTRPLLDDMIGRANEVLNALLRLRKHQIASEQYQSTLLQQRHKAADAAEQYFDNTEPDAWRLLSGQSVSHINNHARQRKRGKRPQFRGRCHSCNISETPEWRRGPDGARTLCNACGLHYAKLARKQQENRGMSNAQLLTTPLKHRGFSSGKLTPPADEIIIDRSPTG
ncbi:hypothetical protein [Parasitella parasitica]|uniref:GATA-type domain-containing protein n=1 Tax=Parasitella parasitica TaxID=35722 RepID=A0A0B7NBG7_9FUNG|nr:hypothetical protein [Parasitella parasitica]